jgi:acyl carrier protein
VICSGEALSWELADRCLMCLDAALHNLYGPTEAAIDVTAWQCQPGEEGPVPIGGPIANTQVYVLDGELAPVPIGVPGELYLGGIGLARGYRHRPGLTADRFCPNPYGPPGSRLYRTGDRARWRPDGVIEYLGRTDTQIKLRGYRIELGEIERVLGQQPGVREAVVLLRADDPDDPRLVGYVVPTGEPPSPATLRTVLQAQLPAYMVPQTWVVLETVPLTPNGKLDRGALPAPGGERPTLEVGYVPPRTAIETTLVGIWQQVLGLDRVGIYDNFFELGGHSLLLLQVHTRITERTNVSLPIVDLLRYPTIHALAQYVNQPEKEQAVMAHTRTRAERRRQALGRAAGTTNRTDR